MIHPYYWEAIAELCEHQTIRCVGCQTNLSFTVSEFAAQVSNCIKKLRLWCSFHPSQTRIDEFLSQCARLRDFGIRFCVGAVGDSVSGNINILTELRRCLPDDVYFWINALERHKYTVEEQRAYQEIDPLFSLETASFDADPSLCSAGRNSLFVEADGSAYACNVSRVRLGSIYGDLIRGNVCMAKECKCYLAYANRIDVPQISIFGENLPFRIPDSMLHP